MAAKKYDVIVIGAGPSGSSAAQTLTAGGLKTLLIEKKKLPRRKMCSGLLSRWTVDFVNRKFGVIPEAAYAETPFLKGIAANFPSIARTVLIPSKIPLPYIRRAPFDNFLTQNCGTEIKDGLQMTDIIPEKNGYKVNCKLFGKDGSSRKTTYTSKYLVAADSSNSRSVRLMIPESIEGMPRCSSVQIHLRGKIDLDPDYFHGFFHRDIGFYSWFNIKDGLIQLGASTLGKRKPLEFYHNFEKLLIHEYGLVIEKKVFTEGMTGLIMGPFNRFPLGKDNFLVSGDACGVMHNGGEGISCALATGEIAGEAIINAEKTGQKAIDIYRENIKGEVDLCLDQFNYLRMSKVMPFSLDLKPVRENHTIKDYYRMYKDLKSYKDQDIGVKETGLAKFSRRNMLHRLILRKYPVKL